MTRLSFWVHLSIFVFFSVATLFFVANDILDLGFFGGVARVITLVTISGSVIYSALFMPTPRELRDYLKGKRQNGLNRSDR
jgi:hypothetical protein